MLVGYHINDGHSSQLANAHIKTMELLDNNYHIYFGGDLSEHNRIFKEEPKRVCKRLRENYADGPTFMEDFCEGLIIHEFIHLLLFDITGSLDTTWDFDNVDDEEQISAPGFWLRGCE